MYFFTICKKQCNTFFFYFCKLQLKFIQNILLHTFSEYSEQVWNNFSYCCSWNQLIVSAYGATLFQLLNLYTSMAAINIETIFHKLMTTATAHQKLDHPGWKKLTGYVLSYLKVPVKSREELTCQRFPLIITCPAHSSIAL